MKITWYSNAPWAGTGYGTQTAQVVRRLRRAGHEVAIAANYGLSANGHTWFDGENVTPVFPQGNDVYSNDVIRGHHLAWGGDWLITLYDVWVLHPQVFEGLRVASWTPVDHAPVPPLVARWCKDHRTIAMSKFGQTVLGQVGVTAPLIPHAIETSVFRPTPSNIRAAMNVPDDAFLVCVNAANKGNMPPRKAWGEMLFAWSMFSKDHPDAYLYIHTQARSPHGIDISRILAVYGVDANRVRFPNEYEYTSGRIADTDLARIYSASDVLLATSMGEGFGIPVIEAQACGLPVIVTDFSAQPELLGAGWKVGWQPYFDFTQDAALAMPLIKEIVRGLTAAYEAKGDATLRAQAVEFAQGYDADLVFERDWKPYLAELEAELRVPANAPRRIRRQEARKRRKAA